MGELAGLALWALSAVSEVRAGDGGVVNFPRIPTPRLFASMREWALRPVMAAGLWAFPDFESVHPEIVGAVNRVLGAISKVLEWIQIQTQFLKLEIREIEETGSEIQVFPHFRVIVEVSTRKMCLDCDNEKDYRKTKLEMSGRSEKKKSDDKA